MASDNRNEVPKRPIRLGLIFSVNKGWMGGTYYIINLINTLATLPAGLRPDITLLCHRPSDWDFALANTNYPGLKHEILRVSPKPITLLKRGINAICRKLHIRYALPTYLCSDSFDAVYPVLTYGQINSKNIIYWIPDLQELHLPHLFSKKEIKGRRDNIVAIANSGNPIVFSSKDALHDFQLHYAGTLANTQPALTNVFRFVVTPPEKIGINDVYQICKKYQVNPGDFFFTPNQFWLHKNHIFLFKCIKRLKEDGMNPKLLCCGNTEDPRNPEYYKSLIQYISDNKLEKNIKLLGMISRKDQVALMQECRAIIQPSLFEGWSTIVEEAKSLGKLLILSELKVHLEQAKDFGIFFNPNNQDSFKDAILSIKDFDKSQLNYAQPYDNNRRNAAMVFINILNDSK